MQSFFAAAEPSIDFDWIRLRGAALFASGDGDPYDDVERGFDAIFENPIFAGADTSYWIRQTIPFAGGGRAVSINGRNGMLNSLRSSKEQGQSNFDNPGTMLLGRRRRFRPDARACASPPTSTISGSTRPRRSRRCACRARSAATSAGTVSAAAIWRPHAIQNVVFRLSGAVLHAGTGFRDLFANETRDRRYYSVLFNAILTY